MRRLWLLIWIIILLPDCQTGEHKTPVGPQLKVSDRGRYLVTEDEKPFFWMGGTVWGMCEWLLFSPFKGWQLTLDMKGAESMKFIKKFCLDNQWPDWIPVYDIIKSKVGKSEFQTVSVIAGPRDKCLVYFPDNNSEILGLSLHFIGVQKFILQWYNPSSGVYTDEWVVVSQGGELTVDPPEGWNDALLILSPQSH